MKADRSICLFYGLLNHDRCIPDHRTTDKRPIQRKRQQVSCICLSDRIRGRSQRLYSWLKKEHFSARHHCFAWRLGADKLLFRANDDGEPSSTAGKPILGQIQKNDLTNILIVVVRYFGGTLLGVGGLIHAYREAAADALLNANIIEKLVEVKFCVEFDYLNMNNVMKIFKDENLPQLKNVFDLRCKIKSSIRKNDETRIFNAFNTIEGINIIIED